MTSFDWCNKCHFTRYIEGYESQQDYIDNGWVKIEYRITDKNGVRENIINWKCPVCDEKDQAQQEKDRLMRLGSVKDPRSKVEYTGAFGAIREP